MPPDGRYLYVTWHAMQRFRERWAGDPEVPRRNCTVIHRVRRIVFEGVELGGQYGRDRVFAKWGLAVVIRPDREDPTGRRWAAKTVLEESQAVNNALARSA